MKKAGDHCAKPLQTFTSEQWETVAKFGSVYESGIQNTGKGSDVCLYDS